MIPKIISVLAAKNSMINTLLLALKKKNYESCDIHTIFDLKKSKEGFLDERPFFSDKFLNVIYITNEKEEDIKTYIDSIKDLEYHNFIIISQTRKQFDCIKEIDSSIQAIDLFNPPEILIRTHLDMTVSATFMLDAYETFKKRINKQWNYLDTFIMQFNLLAQQRKEDTFDDVVYLTDKDVKKIITVEHKINFTTMTIDLLLGRPINKHLKYLGEFRYAYKFIYEQIQTRLNTILEMKKQVLLKNLRNTNIQQYALQKKLSSYEVQQFFYEVIPYYTLEELYLIKEKYRRYNGNDAYLFFLMDTAVIHEKEAKHK